MHVGSILWPCDTRRLIVVTSQVPPYLWPDNDGHVRVLEQHASADKYAHVLVASLRLPIDLDLD